MNTYTRAKAFVRQILDEANYSDVAVYPGPDLPDVPGAYVLLTSYGGPGLELGEGVLDGRSWQVRTVGEQMDYESAEGIANAIDIAFISRFSSDMDGAWVASIGRVGGAPNPLMTDDADRTHFVCSYVASVELALPN